MREENQTDWHLDKRVPLAVIFAMMMQTAAVIWWAAGIAGDVSDLKDFRADILNSGKNREIRIQYLEKEVPVIKEKIENIRGTTDRIERKIDKLSLNWHNKTEARFNDSDLIQLSLRELMEIKTS